jgi:hypothetical protein
VIDKAGGVLECTRWRQVSTNALTARNEVVEEQMSGKATDPDLTWAMGPGVGSSVREHVKDDDYQDACGR